MFNDNELQKLLIKYPDKPWNWKYISQNPNLTMEMIEKNSDKPWDWKYISDNTFNYIKKQKKRNLLIWGYVFRWLLLPITRDGKLGISVRLGMKLLYDLKEAPFCMSEIKQLCSM